MRGNFKVVVLGEGRVGKTSIVHRYTTGDFEDKRKNTVKAYCTDKTLTVGSTQVQLSIWDTAGQECFHALGPIYYRDAAGALLVYDITDRQSFEKVQNWVKELKKIVGNDIVIVIAGNKIDMEKNRHVNNSDAERYVCTYRLRDFNELLNRQSSLTVVHVCSYAASVGAAHFQTSAKANRGLDEVFNHLASSKS